MLLYKYRPWNSFTAQVIQEKKIFFPSKQRLNDLTELIHPVHFEPSMWDDAFERVRTFIKPETYALADNIHESFTYLDALESSHPEVRSSEEYGRYLQYLHISDLHWRVVEAVFDKASVDQAIAYYMLNLAEDKCNRYYSEAQLVQRLNAKLDSIGILSLAARLV